VTKTVYKLKGESYEITEESYVYSTYKKAVEAIKEWEGFLGMSTEEALTCEEVIIQEWVLV
jgi:hypothetical protein